MKDRYLYIFFLLCTILVLSCKNRRLENEDCFAQKGKLFSLLPSTYTNIEFRNDLTYTEEFNTYTYRNFYNGGGVAIGDINNDGLQDIFFTGNMVSNKLYLNNGNFKFTDVTDKSGLNSTGVWSTGVSLVDINGDGWQDIYICKSGKPEGEKRHNELFINQGIDENGAPKFKEMAKIYGVADYGLSTHSAFFDYDKDGDLDMYLLNNSIRSIGIYNLKKDQRLIRDPNGGNKLYRNDGNRFTDVSEEAGIYGSTIGFGLGVTIGDVNKDGWQDIFVSNDFFEKDYLYFNNGDGTFTESLENVIGEISLGSMGADMADINNDGFPEIFVTEMLPKEEGRLKTKTIFEDWNKYTANIKAGYYRQFPRNILQLNRGYSNTEEKIFMSEIGRFSGIEATDWSWGALMADLDNDGLKDLFVANGIYKDLIDLDYLNFYADPMTTKKLFDERGSYLKELIDSIPSNPIANFAFKNNGDLTFSDKAKEWGLACNSFSNGSSYGDLDNDGDLDLVVNNVNMEAFVYRNNSDSLFPKNHYLNIQLQGKDLNKGALGSQVTVYSEDKMLYQELAPMRGYQSSVDNRLHFGLGSLTKIDSILIRWPDLSVVKITQVALDQFLNVSQNEGMNDTTYQELRETKGNVKPWFTKVENSNGIDYFYKKSSFNDFDRDPLLFHMLSAEGAKIAIGDVNGDSRDDAYLGGSKGEPGVLYVQTENGTFINVPQQSFKVEKSSMDSGSTFFDADNDGDLDLYICSGGNEFPASSASLVDRLYLNDGNGVFSKSEQVLPTSKYENTSCVEAADFDQDGDLDLFVGVRSIPFLYGVPSNGYLLRNNGKGIFENVTNELAHQLIDLGMITDAKWFDYDGDGDKDLVIVGDWMPLSIFENQNGKLKQTTKTTGLKNTNGFWNTIEVGDLDNDGDIDLVAGNLGTNTRLKALPNHPIEMYVNDFDRNGKIEQIVTSYKGDRAYPWVGRSELVAQLPYLKKKYLKFNEYKEKTVEDIFGKELINESIKLNVSTTASSAFINNTGVFQENPLPAEAQFSPIYAIQLSDFDNDGIVDMLLGGNFHWSKPEMGIYDGTKGTLLRGNGDGTFEVISANESGVFIDGEIRDMTSTTINNKRSILISRINDSLIVLKNDL